MDAVHICTPNALHHPMATRGAAGRQARDLRKAAGHVSVGRRRTWWPWRARPSAAIAPSTTCASTPWCSRCAACAKTATWARSWWCRAPTRRTGCSTTPIGTGALDSKDNGPSRCMADIGSHWCDMAEHITGLRITSLCADLQTFHKTRKRPKGPIETFAGKTLEPEDYVETPIDTEDFGAVIFRMGDRTRGAFTASQVSAGRKNRLSMEDLRHQGRRGLGPGAARRTVDRPAQRPQPDHHQGPVAAEGPRAVLRRSAGRPQRRLRRYLQAGVPPLLRLHRRPVRASPNTRSSSTACAASACGRRTREQRSGAAGWTCRRFRPRRRSVRGRCAGRGKCGSSSIRVLIPRSAKGLTAAPMPV